SYTQQTIDNFHTLRKPNNYNTVRAAARDIVFSCRYNNPHLNPTKVIAALLRGYTRFTLRFTLPLNFQENAFDLYIESTILATPIQPAQITDTFNDLSPILRP